MPKRERMVAHPVMAKRAASRGVVLIMTISIITAVEARAQSKLANSAWPAFRHDARMTAFRPAKGPVLPEVKWKAQFGSGALGSPVLGLDGTIYVPGNVDSALYAITPDGKRKWVFVGKVKEGELFVAPPIIGQDGKIYLGSTQNIFYAINPNGREHWSLKLGGAISFSANIDNDGTIYVAAQDYNLYAITPAGKIKWRVNLGQLPANGPAIAEDGTIYVVAGEFLKGFKQDGTLQLEFNSPDMGFLNGLMVEGKELFYITSLDKPLIRAINNVPRILWEQELDPSFKGALLPALGKDGRIYFPTEEEGGVVALDQNGNKRWIFTVPGALNLTELVVDDSNHVYLVNDKLGLTSVSADGKLRWSLPEVRCAFSPAIGADGTIYVASDKKLYAIGPQPPFAMSLAKVFGDAQRGCLRSILANPIQVLLKDQYGAPFPNHPVQFRILSGGGSVSNTQVLTDNNGIAQVFWTLGPLAGEQRLEASSQIGGSPLAGSPQIFSAIAQTPKISGAPVLVFDPIAVKLTSKKVYTIQNNSDCNLVINNLEILNDAEGNFALALNAAQLVNVQPGESLAVSMQYTPQDCNADSATLRISSDDPQTPQFDVTLRGTILSEPDIDAAPSALSFGEVLAGDSKLLPIAIRNAGAERLRIDSVVVRSPVFAVEPQEFLLECNESNDKVSIAFMPVARGHFVDTLLIWSNDPDEKPFVVPLVGTGIGPAIVVEPDSLDFGAACSGRDSVQFVTVKNIGEDTLRVNALVFSNPAFSTTLVPPFGVPPNDSVKIPVKYAYVAEREDNGTLTISTNASGDSTVTVALHGKGEAPDIAVTAPPFGDVCIGTIKSIQVCISNPSDCELRVDSLEIIVITGAMNLQAPEALATATSGPLFVIPPHGQECFNIRGAPLREGSFRLNLIIWSNVPGKSPLTITIPGTGVPPAIASVDKVDFGQVKIGDSVQKPAQVWNAESCEVRIDSLKIEGGTTAAFSLGAFGVPKVLNAGDTTGIPVNFVPTRKAQYSDTLLVFNNDPRRSPLKIALAGVGGDCPAAISVKPTALQYGDAPVGDTVSKDLTISNEGCDTLRITDMHNNLPAIFYVNAADRQFNLAPGDERVVPVFFAPVADTVYLDTLRIDNNDTTVLVPLNGRGIVGPGSTDIAVKPGALDFGVVCGPVDSMNIVVSNEGKASLQVDSLRFSNTAFFTRHADSFVVVPGDSEEIIVHFTPVAGRDDTGTLSIFSNDPDENPFVVNVHGKGGVPDIAGASEVKFDTVSVACSGLADTARRTYVIRNVGICDLQIETLIVTGDFSIISGGGTQTIAPNDSAIVVLQFAPQAPVAHVDTLKIFSNDPDESPFKVVLRGVGVAVPTIAVEPDTLDFGDVPAGSSKRLTIKITSRGVITLRVDSLVSSCRPVFTTEADEFILACGEDSSVTVAFSPSAPGPIECTLSIYTNDPKNNPAVVTLRGNGVTGILAACESIDFGKTCADNPVTKECTLTNISKIADVEIVDLQLVSGKDFSFAGSIALPIILTPQESRTVQVIFRPEKTGPARNANDTLLIFTKFSDQKRGITLRGQKRSEGPDLVLLTSSLEFWGALGKATPCTSAVIVNEGCSPLMVNDLQLAGFTNVFEICSNISTPLPLAPSQSMAVDVLFKPIDFAEFKDELRIYSDDRDKNPALVELTGRVQIGGICLESDSTKIRFGRVYRNTAVTVMLGVTNCSNPSALLKVEALPLRLKDFTVEPGELPNVTPDTKQFFNVTFKPGVTGDRVDTLKLLVTSVFGDNAQTEVRIPLSGTGIDDEVYALPNAFTPNGDDKNDYAKIHFPGYKMVSPVLRIYDLRGIAIRVLRRSNSGDDEIAWDGYQNESRSRLMPPGAYVWFLEDQGKKVGSGMIVLIR